MPTLFRLIVVLGVIAGLVYGAMLAMVTLIHPQQRQIVQSVPLPRPSK